MISEETRARVTGWLFGDDTGNSSKFLAGVALGQEAQVAYPYDPSDFGRCYRLFKLMKVSEVEAVLGRAAELSPHWARILANWTALVELYQEECVGEAWVAPKLYRLMQDIHTVASYPI